MYTLLVGARDAFEHVSIFRTVF